MLTLFVTSLLAGCSIFGVYKVDIPQGTPLTKAQASQVQVGMNFQQVRFLLGSPTVTDPSIHNVGTISTTISREHMLKSENPAAHGQHLKIYFDGTGTVTKIEGLETIPESQPGLPASKEAILTAPPL